MNERIRSRTEPGLAISSMRRIWFSRPFGIDQSSMKNKSGPRPNELKLDQLHVQEPGTSASSGLDHQFGVGPLE